MSTNDGASIWHARLGLLRRIKLKDVVLQNLVKGLPMFTTFGSDEVCDVVNMEGIPFDKSFSQCKSPLELIYGDLMGPCTTPSYSGSFYMLVLIDDYTRFTRVYFIKEKLKVLSRFKEFKETVENTLNKKFELTMGESSLISIFTIFVRSTTSKENFHEHIYYNKMLWRKGRFSSWWRLAGVAFMQRTYPKPYRQKGMSCATYVINRVPLSLIKTESPYELTFEEKPSVKHFKVFGSICYVHVLDAKRTKLDAKAHNCIFLCYDERKKRCKCMDPRPIKFVFLGMLYLMKSLLSIWSKVLFLEVLVVTLVFTINHIHKLVCDYCLMLLCHQIALLLLHLRGSNPIGRVVLVTMSWKDSKVMSK